MTKEIPKGCFYLTPGVRLIPEDGEGILLQNTPLRALRVNATAYGILEKCRTGFSLEDHFSGESADLAKSFFSFLDSLCQKHLLEWKPSTDAFQPFVSVIIPVYNRAHEIGACLESLLLLDYPSSKLEIIVVDDGSEDNTVAVVGNYKVNLIVQPQNQGQSAARNAGVKAAQGEIMAFIDSDCIADSRWLGELVPYFQDPRIVLVGGYVASFYTETCLDRYEETKSPLNMGETTVIGSTSDSDFYVPTCNMLVRKDAYLGVGGLDESLRVGEDVDLCWKLKHRGNYLTYAPEGRIRHKHRNQFWESFKRRFDYGTSEAFLFTKHREVKKRFPFQPANLSFFLFCCLGLLTKPYLFFPMAATVCVGESLFHKIRIRNKIKAPVVPFTNLLMATLKEYKILAYYLTFHFIRYYLLLIVLVTVLFPSVGFLAAAVVLFPATVEFFEKKPRLIFPLFLLFYLVEQIFYQTGVFWGCLRLRSFEPYHLSFKSTRNLRKAGV
jgi:mycofactocin system glycosyltransferase